MELRAGKCRIVLDPGFPAMICCLFLWGSPALLREVLLVSFLHEAGHGVAMLLTGAGIRELRLHAAGMQMITHTACLRTWERVCICLSGPAVNLGMAALLWGGETAWLHLLTGGFNLLPFRVLDGGAVLADWRGRRALSLLTAALLLTALLCMRVRNPGLYGMLGYLVWCELH